MNDFSQVKSNRYLMKLTIPVFIEIFLGVLIGLVDQFMLSDNKNAFNAIAQANQIINMLVITFNVVAMASTILIAQYIGSRNVEKVKQLYSLSIFVNVIFGVAISLILLFFNKPIFAMMDMPPDIAVNATKYISIVGGAMFLHAIALTFSAFFKANGFMKESMYVTLIINITNVVGNAVLIYGWFGLPKLGIVGVAISSIISKLVGVLLFISLYKKQIGEKIGISQLKPFPTGPLKKILGIGVPSAGENLSYSFAMVTIQTTINKLSKRFGEHLITARTTIGLLCFMSWIFAASISSTTQVIVGYLMGAGDVEGTQKRYKASLGIAMLLSLAGSLLLYFLAEPVVSIFSSDPDVIALCKKILFIDIFLEQGRAVNMSTVRALQACGDTKFPIIVGIIDVWLVAALGGYILGNVFGLGLVGVWCAMAADEIIRGVIFTIRWNGGKWRKMRLVS